MIKDIEPGSKQVESIVRRRLRWVIENPVRSLLITFVCIGSIYGLTYAIDFNPATNHTTNTSPDRNNPRDSNLPAQIPTSTLNTKPIITPTARVAERPTPNPAGTPIKTEREMARSDGLDFTAKPSPSPLAR